MNESPVHVLENIIYARRSIRTFTDEVPDSDLIKLLIQAGYAAPYAAQAVQGSPDYRRFIVIRNNTDTMQKITDIARQTTARMAEQLEQSTVPADLAEGFIQMLRNLSTGAIPGFSTAPYLIIVAERKGFPPAEQQSIAHCLQNMWLMATAFGLGFHLVSLISQMSESAEFCQLIQIPFEEFSLNGCAIGIPREIPPHDGQKDAEKVTLWIET